MRYIAAGVEDAPAIARLRALTEPQYGGGEQYFGNRVASYIQGRHHPQHALAERIVYIAVDDDAIVGYVAAHLTRRFGCDGELQWIYVAPDYRGGEVAGALLGTIAIWFSERRALRVCVDVEAGNGRAEHFYIRHGAVRLSNHWMVWKDVRGALLRSAGTPSTAALK